LVYRLLSGISLGTVFQIAGESEGYAAECAFWDSRLPRKIGFNMSLAVNVIHA
jgi:hypothetical protein